MNKYLKKILVTVLAVICACSIHFTVSALNEVTRASIENNPIRDIIASLLFGTSTTAPPSDESTAAPNGEGTTVKDPGETTTVKDPVNNSGTGTVTTTTQPQTFNYTPNQNPNINQNPNGQFNVTVPTTLPETTTFEEESETVQGSLDALLEKDSAVQIITPQEPYTIGSQLVVKNDKNSGSFPWQTVVLIAAAVLFIILAALVAALLIQRGKRNSKVEIKIADAPSEDNAPVVPEVMTRERIAELLGSASQNNRDNRSDREENIEYTGAQTAEAIKNAVLMGQLSGAYSDPLIRKYTDEPVMFSQPKSKFDLDPDSSSVADILKATDSMLADIAGNEKFAQDVSGVKFPDLSESAPSASPEASKLCPECGNPIEDGNLYCHNCGAYAGV